ncbi:MAG: hypothetical protein KDA22_02320 [Phycisphaerales bacterium]|nr:hypothetical protein [Phycisphaerales bacterium]
MSFVSKTSSLQAYNMLLFRKAVHPEFFGIEGRRRIEHGDYEFEAWIFKGGHAVRFQHDGHCVCEVVTDQSEQVPDRGLVGTFPCAGEKDHEEKISDNLLYLTTIQTETLTDHLYLGTYKEMLQHGRDGNSLMSVWTDEFGKANLSLLDIQRYRTEVHIQAYHLRSDCGLVLRSQSMFQTEPEEIDLLVADVDD